jgi:hypothetical protein
MHKTLAATALFVVAGLSPLHAQPFEFLGWGVQGGITEGYVDYAGTIPWLYPGWGLGFTISPFAEFSLARTVRLQCGLRYDRLKNHSNVASIDYRGWGEIVLDAFSIPLFTKVTVGSAPAVFFVAGPEFGLIWRAESRTGVHGRVNGGAFYGESSSDITDIVDRFNFALDAGLGIEFDAGGHAFFVQGLYCHGLASLAKKGQWILDWRTSEVAVTAGVVF